MIFVSLKTGIFILYELKKIYPGVGETPGRCKEERTGNAN